MKDRPTPNDWHIRRRASLHEIPSTAGYAGVVQGRVGRDLREYVAGEEFGRVTGAALDFFKSDPEPFAIADFRSRYAGEVFANLSYMHLERHMPDGRHVMSPTRTFELLSANSPQSEIYNNWGINRNIQDKRLVSGLVFSYSDKLGAKLVATTFYTASRNIYGEFVDKVKMALSGELTAELKGQIARNIGAYVVVFEEHRCETEERLLDLRQTGRVAVVGLPLEKGVFTGFIDSFMKDCNPLQSQRRGSVA